LVSPQIHETHDVVVDDPELFAGEGETNGRIVVNRQVMVGVNPEAKLSTLIG